MTSLAAAFVLLTCISSIGGFAAPKSQILGVPPPADLPSSSTRHRASVRSPTTRRRGGVLRAAPDGLHWFVKTEQFCRPFPEVKPHLDAHRAWVQALRTQHTIVSGYRVDAEDRPGGGGLMIFAAEDYAAAEALVRCDPLIANECVDWQLNKWIAETGDISIDQ